MNTRKPHLRPQSADTAWNRGLDDETSPYEQSLPNEDSFFLALFIILVIIFCLIFILRSPAQFCRHLLCRGDDDEREERERRFRDSLRPSTAAGQFQNKQDRLDFISNVLVTKHVILAGGSKHASSVHKFHNIIIPRLNSSVHSAVDDEMLDPCSICLNEYEEGDEICWSHNKHCDHIFHRHCIIEWLLRHDECPICRQDFLSLDYLDEEVPETTKHGVTSQHVAEERDPASDGHENAATEARLTASVEPHPFSMVAMFQRSHLVRPSQRTIQATRRHALELSQTNEERVRQRQLTNHDESTLSDTGDSTTDGLEDVELESIETEDTESSVSVSV